jgi:hypothetical protein
VHANNPARIVKVHIHEETKAYLKHGFNAIINIGFVYFDTYSTTLGTVLPAKASIIVREADDPKIKIFSSQTQFNVLSSSVQNV